MINVSATRNGFLFLFHVALAHTTSHLLQTDQDQDDWPSHTSKGVGNVTRGLTQEDQTNEHNEQWNHFVMWTLAHSSFVHRIKININIDSIHQDYSVIIRLLIINLNINFF